MKKENKNQVNIAVCGSLETDTGQKTSTLVEQLQSIKDINVKVIYSQVIKEAELILRTANMLKDYKYVDRSFILDDYESQNIYTDNIKVLLEPEDVDIMIVTEVDTEVAAGVIYQALIKSKNVINMNAVSEITLGLFFKKLAESKDVIYTVGAGDEPAATLELIRFCDLLGLDVICAGKGKNNPLNVYCTPGNFTKKAEQVGVSPRGITSFVDGTKTMLEMAILSNATGYSLDVDGMHGPDVGIEDLVNTFDLKKKGGILNSTPAIDYAIGDVAPGVFVIFTSKQKTIVSELNYLKMGSGPNFLLYKPYHLGNIESPLSIFDIKLGKKPTLTVKDRMTTSVAAKAKHDLKKGSMLDRVGGYDFYGFAIGYSKMLKNNLVPIGLVEKSLVKKNVKKGKLISFDDIECNKASIIYKLYSSDNK